MHHPACSERRTLGANERELTEYTPLERLTRPMVQRNYTREDERDWQGIYRDS